MSGASPLDPTDVAAVSSTLLAVLDGAWPGTGLREPPRFVPVATSTWVW